MHFYPSKDRDDQQVLINLMKKKRIIQVRTCAKQGPCTVLCIFLKYFHQYKKITILFSSLSQNFRFWAKNDVKCRHFSSQSEHFLSLRSLRYPIKTLFYTMNGWKRITEAPFPPPQGSIKQKILLIMLFINLIKKLWNECAGGGCYCLLN